MKTSSPRASRLIRKLSAAATIAAVGFGIALCSRIPGPLANSMSAGNDLFYDIYYRLRPFEDRTSAPVVIVAADQVSLDEFDRAKKWGWPWPRELWGAIATYLADSGAKAIVFDITFNETSRYQRESADDDAFADAINAIKIPVIFASLAHEDGSFDHFAPPVASPHLAAANVNSGKIYRQYLPRVFSRDSMALAAVKAAHASTNAYNGPFLLHYYGPNITPDAKNTFTYVPAVKIYDAFEHGNAASVRTGFTSDFFKGKIVLLGAVTQGTYDLKASPLADKYPGVEVQATAIENLIEGERVVPLANVLLILFPIALALAVSVSIILPRRASLKLLAPALAVTLLFAVGIWLFRSPHIHWLPPGESLLALLITTPAAFAYTFFAEDRQRRFMLRALSKVVSPAVAEQLANDPQRLVLGTIRTDLSVLFTDLANFTSMSEHMADQQVGELLNQYLSAMSDQVLLNNGTLDKYIGDAVMCFWNAPLPQADHAVLACRTALAMLNRETKMRQELGPIGEALHTRIGINTTSAAVGFVGSSHLFNYTAIGDGINLASRLEGANKIYGTRILISQNTADLVRSRFYLRRIDKLRVKGRSGGIFVYEVLAERSDPSPPSIERIDQYEAALAAYQKQEWNTAEQILLEICTRFGEDSASQTLLKRIAILRHSPPPVDWDGTYDAKDK